MLHWQLWSTSTAFSFITLLAAMDFPTVDFFILDVEGAELGILQTISWHQVNIVLTEKRPYKHTILTSINYLKGWHQGGLNWIFSPWQEGSVGYDDRVWVWQPLWPKRGYGLCEKITLTVCNRIKHLNEINILFFSCFNSFKFLFSPHNASGRQFWQCYAHHNLRSQQFLSADIRPKSEQIGGDCLLAKRNWRNK